MELKEKMGVASYNKAYGGDGFNNDKKKVRCVYNRVTDAGDLARKVIDKYRVMLNI